MALRVRQDGRLLCAATHSAEPGDTYLDDGLHGRLAGVTGGPCLIVTEPMHTAEGRGGHAAHGEWWWHDKVPADVAVDAYYTRSV